ncbi:MAG: DegT/DnrJ/EryC1/StrS family aminotransferase [Elusimicrobiota bacterium]
MDLKSQYSQIRQELLDAASRVLDSGAYILGPEGRAFEAEFAKALGVAHVAGVSSGTKALELSIEALGVGPGDEVAVPAFTFIATATAACAKGARPVFVDVDPRSLTMDPADLERRVTPKTKAVIPVHLYGRPADMDRILDVCKARKLRVLEDCAQAHLAAYKGRPVGGIGDLGAFSFYPSKNLGALGDAGAVSTRSPELHDLVLMLRNCGRPPGKQYEHARLGHNSRLDDLQAAFLRVKLKRLQDWTARRRAVADLYRSRLAGLPVTLPPEEGNGTSHVYHLFIIQAPKRDGLAKHLQAAGIGCGVYYPKPLHLLEAFKQLGYKAGDFPQAERACGEVLALPMYPELSPEMVDRVAEAVREFY